MGMSLRALSGIALGAALLCGSAVAKDFVYGSWVAPRHGVNIAALEPFFKDVAAETKGTVTWKLLTGGQVVSSRSTLPSVRDRLIDAGLVIPVFTQKELATSNVFYDLQNTGTDVVAVAGAATETVLLHCAECRDEYRRQKAVYLAGYGVTPFRLMCASQITGLSELQGKKIRATGRAAHLFSAMKATTVNIPPNEGAEAMQRGAVDCAHGSVAWLKSFGYIDVTKHVIDFSFGFPRGLGMFVMNRDAWNSLSLDEKKAMLKHLPAASARATIIGYIGEDAESKKDGMARGITFRKPGGEFDELMAKYRVEERNRVIEDSKSLGVKDPEKIALAFEKILPKWEKLAKDIDENVDKFAAALKTEIYDKIDPGKL